MIEIVDLVGDYQKRNFYYVQDHTLYTVKIKGFACTDGKLQAVDIGESSPESVGWCTISHHMTRDMDRLFADYKEAEDLLTRELLVALHQKLQDWNDACKPIRMDGSVLGMVGEVIDHCAWILKLNEKGDVEDA